MFLFLIKCGGSVLKIKPNPDAKLKIQKGSPVNITQGVKSSHCAVLASWSMKVWRCRISCCLQEKVWASDLWAREDCLQGAHFIFVVSFLCDLGQFTHFIWAFQTRENDSVFLPTTKYFKKFK